MKLAAVAGRTEAEPFFGEKNISTVTSSKSAEVVCSSGSICQPMV